MTRVLAGRRPVLEALAFGVGWLIMGFVLPMLYEGSLAESLKNHQPGIRSTGTGIRFQVKPESPAG